MMMAYFGLEWRERRGRELRGFRRSFEGAPMKSLILVLPWLALAGTAASAASDPSFTLAAGAEDFGSYFPSYLATAIFPP